MEQAREKSKLSRKGSKFIHPKLYQEQPQSSQPNLKKKINKNHHRKKGQLSRGQEETKNELSQFLEKNNVYFSQTNEESIQFLKKKIESEVHINDVLDNQNTFCFKNMKENNQRQLEVYFNLLNNMRKYLYFEKIELFSPPNKTKLNLRYFKQVTGHTEQGYQISTVRRILNENEFTLLKLRQQAIAQIERLFNQYTDSKRYNRVQVSQDLLQLMSLCKLNATIERDVSEKFDLLLSNKDSLYKLQLSRNRDQANEKFLQSQLIEAMMIKNLEKSFSETPIDFFNYHKANEYYQQNNYIETPFDRITFFSQFKKYALAKKPKSQKSDCYLLRTACTACLTQFSELSNPIQNCPQCHMRIHRHCQKIENRCHRCRYGRTSNLQKSQTSYCYICNRQREKGLMILTVTNRSPHQYAHEYCLLLHRFWKIQNQEFTGEYRSPPSHNNCQFCQNNQGHFFYCRCCSTPMHGMCAYLNGASFQMKRIDNEYKVEIKCCNDSVQKQRLSMQRKFKINYEKMIFREDEKLFQYISSKWKKRYQE